MKYIKLLFLCLIVQSCTAQTSKINGVSFVASGIPVNDVHVNPVVNVNANYAAVMPFGYIKNLQHPEVKYNSDRQWFGESRKGAKQYAETLKAKRIKIMLKP